MKPTTGKLTLLFLLSTLCEMFTDLYSQVPTSWTLFLIEHLFQPTRRKIISSIQRWGQRAKSKPWLLDYFVWSNTWTPTKMDLSNEGLEVLYNKITSLVTILATARIYLALSFYIPGTILGISDLFFQNITIILPGRLLLNSSYKENLGPNMLNNLPKVSRQ